MRAALLAGVSFVAIVVTTPTEANPYQWGAMRPPASIYIYEPMRRPKTAVRPVVRPNALPRAAKPRTEKYRTGTPAYNRIERGGSRSFRYRSYGFPPPPYYSPYPSRPSRLYPPGIVRSRTGRNIRIEETTTGKTTKSEKSTKTADKVTPVVPKGALHVIVSIDQQRASLYADGAFVASTKVSTGTKSHPTPMGVFSVIQKNRHHVSNLYGAPMPYMQRLTWSGTAMHTGPLPGYPASHGCIRLTNDFAQMLWKATRIGARVIVTRDDVTPHEIAHERLNFPEAPAAEPAVETSDAPDNPRAPVRTADATGSLPQAAMSASAQSAATAGTVPPIMVEPSGAAPAASIRKPGPVSIFISRKDAKLYVRQAMKPLFDVPLTLRNAAEPIGTHVYTAMDVRDGAMRWTAVSIPSGFPHTSKVQVARKGGKKSVEATGSQFTAPHTAPDASAALDRIEIPQATLDRLAGLVSPGSSLIVSDNPLSHETGRGTEFVVLTK